MSLHYLVKLEMLIMHMLSLSPKFISPSLWPLSLSDLNPVDYSVGILR